MKRIILTLLIGLAIYCIPCPAFAQTTPGGANVRFAYGTWYLDNTYYTWGNRADNYADTLAIGAGKWTDFFMAPEGNMNQEGVAILTAATDSFKIILYGSNSQIAGITIDTTMLTRLDSTKVLAAGLYAKVWDVAGKWKPSLVEQFVPLNPGATVTGKSRRNSISLK